MHDCTVFARDGMHLELCRNPLVCTVIFTDNQRSGRILINAMYDSRTKYTVNSGQIIFAVIHYCIYKSVLIMPRRR